MIPVHIGLYRDSENFYTYNKDKNEFEFKEKLPDGYMRNVNSYVSFLANSGTCYMKKRKRRS